MSGGKDEMGWDGGGCVCIGWYGVGDKVRRG